MSDTQSIQNWSAKWSQFGNASVQPENSALWMGKMFRASVGLGYVADPRESEHGVQTRENLEEKSKISQNNMCRLV